MAERGIVVPDGCETLSVNYAQVLAEAIRDGKFDWKNDNITSEHFMNADHETDEATLTIKLFHFGRDMLSGNAVKEMNKKGFRPATLRELLAYAVKNPDEQRRFPILALGSIWEGLSGLSVPHLNIGHDGRLLGLYWWHSNWTKRCRFLAVRKS